MRKKKTYYVHRNSGDAVFVKEVEFFKEQGGLTERWGKAWRKVRAYTIEHARTVGEKVIPRHD